MIFETRNNPYKILRSEELKFLKNAREILEVMITSITITILQYDQESFINFPFEETVSEIDLDQPALCNFNYTHAIILCVNSSAVFFIFYPKKTKTRREYSLKDRRKHVSRLSSRSIRSS